MDTNTHNTPTIYSNITNITQIYTDIHRYTQTTDNRQQTTDNRQQTTDNRQQTTKVHCKKCTLFLFCAIILCKMLIITTIRV